MQLNDILARFDKVKSLGDGEFEALCPSHNDIRPSLHIRRNENKILINCKAGCDTKDIVKAVGLSMADLFIDGNKPNSSADPHIEKIYVYCNADGSINREVLRYPLNSKPRFRQRRPDGREGYIWNVKDTPNVLYHLPEVLATMANGEIIHITEGERDCDNLWTLGLESTTNLGGSGKWLPENSESLKGANVVIFQDSDQVGRDHARVVANSLFGKAKSLKLLPPFEGFKDVSDWLENGGSLESLKKLMSECPYYSPVDSETLSEPIVTSIPSGWEFSYATSKETSVVVQLRDLSRGRGNTLTSEIDIYTSPPTLISPVLGVNINLGTLEGIKRVADNLTKDNDLICWKDILSDVRRRAITLYRQGNVIEESCPSEAIEPVKYLVEPLIHEDNSTTIFGDKGTLKSLFAECITIAVTLSWQDNPLGLIVPSEPIPVLYLDYERSKQVFDWRHSLIIKGHNLPTAPIKYLRCYQPLADIIDRIERAKYEFGIKLLVIDSLAQACGGNVNEAENAIRFHSALRRLNLSSLILAQTSKDPLSKSRSVFGSTFFEYYTSSIWEAKKAQEEGSPELIMSLTHKKYNLSEKHTPLGFKFTFVKELDGGEATEIRVARTDLSKTELSSELYLKDRIYNLLIGEGKMELQEIAEALDVPKGSVKAKLYGYKGKMFVQIDGGWGAIGRGEFDE